MKNLTTNYTILFDNKSPDIHKILDLHKTDKLKARILVKNEPHKYQYHRKVLFEKDNSFNIIEETISIRISTNNKMYFVQTNKTSYVYKDNKFWFIQGIGKHSRVLPLVLAHFTSSILEVFLNKFSWLRFIHENQVFNNVPFNTIVKYKLYNYNDLLKYIYKSNLPTAKLMLKSNISSYRFKEISKHCINLNENSNTELFNTINLDSFNDTIRMANILNKKVNCQWSIKRLTQEHDNWAKEITNIVMEESNRPLNIKAEYLEFAKQNPDLKIITTTKELALEGLIQSHCVATYSSSIDNGNCAIFHINGYTADIRLHNKVLLLNQFKGYKNCQAPEELNSFLLEKLENYNMIHSNRMELIY